MSIVNTPLFVSDRPEKIGVGFHNVGSGVLRASHQVIVKQIEAHYGERCGHIPLNAERIRVLVDTPTAAIQAQMTYLSHLFGKELKAINAAELLHEQQGPTHEQALVVPYINVPETAQHIQAHLGAQSWGIAAPMVNVLKNKASFYQLVNEFDLPGFQAPDYRIAHIDVLETEAFNFLRDIETIVREAGIGQYPLGVVLRAAESDGNYGCCLVYEQNDLITVVPNGDVGHITYYSSWHEALEVAQAVLAATMDVQKEARVVMSRFLDMIDSPGMSVVIIDGQIESLGWNGQLQKDGSKACIGTSTYRPQNATLARLQQLYEGQTTVFFETLLRKTAQKCGIDFASLRGVANIDIMLPGPLEERLQKQRDQQPVLYLAECNPRWTNYTDAIMAVIGANHREQTISNMRTVIREGIATFDKYPLPENVDPLMARELIYQRDDVLKQDGTRIICRMAKNPMGLIFAGNVARAQQEVVTILRQISHARVG